MATIPFDDIVPGATVRFTVIQDMQYLSVRDVLMHICDLSSVRANEKWRLLPDEVKTEVVEFICNFQFPGKGNKFEPVITFKGALKLAMLVSGQKAALYRSTMVNILQRYYAGDGSLTDEIAANAQSDAPIHQIARASIAAEYVLMPVQDEESLSRKRRLEDLEIEKLELELSIRRRESDFMTSIKQRESELDLNIRRRETEFELAAKITGTYRDLCQDTVMDERARLMLKDYYLNMVMQSPLAPAQRLLSDGQAPPSPASKPISLSQVAVEMGLKIPSNDLISLGCKLRKRYEESRGHPPGKHDQLCSGRVTKVNSYMESDRALVSEVLREWVAPV
jgi:hypothetical protein